jgi:hypothetical protein
MLLKILRWPTHIVLLPAYLLAEIVTWGFVLRSDRGNLANKVLAYVWVLRNWKAILKSRRSTQRLRKVPDRELLGRTAFRLDYSQFRPGLGTRLARILFDPLFFLLRQIALRLVWW